MGLFDRFKKATEPEPVAPAAPVSKELEVKAPVAGELVQLSETSEPVFSSEMMGKGVAIKPTGSTIVAPIDGELSAVMPHAVGLLAANGAEVLIHVGIDTVNMEGDGFKNLVAQGATVTAGTPLIEFSHEKIAAAGYENTVFVLVTNTADCEEVAPVANCTVQPGDVIVNVTK